MQGLGLIVILFFFGLAGGAVGRMKGSSFFVWFLVSFCLPFLGLLGAICYRREDRELRRQCPSCRRVVKLNNAVCMNCGAELYFPAVGLASEAAARGAHLPSREGRAAS